MDELFNPYEGLLDEIEDPGDEGVEVQVSEPLKQVGRDKFPRHPMPDGADQDYIRIWGSGEPIVTPRLRDHLDPGELELYEGGLGRKIRHYAWSRVDALGTGRVDPEELAQEALIQRWADPRELSPADMERFAIRTVRFASTKMAEKSRNRSEAENRALESVAPEFVPQTLSEGSWAWIQHHLSEKSAEAVRLVLEEQYKHGEAGTKVGLTDRAVRKAFAKLREEAARAQTEE